MSIPKYIVKRALCDHMAMVMFRLVPLSREEILCRLQDVVLGSPLHSAGIWRLHMAKKQPILTRSIGKRFEDFGHEAVQWTDIEVSGHSIH